MLVPSIVLAIPLGAKMNAQSLAVTAVGIAHGTRTAARRSERPQMLLPMTTAMAKPSTVSSETVVTVKNRVLPMAGQKSTAETPGGQGMVLGQALDIAAESTATPLNLDQITTLQQAKTGALILWAATAGARMADADLAPLSAYARALGLAFQIQDDVIDVTGDATAAGKAVGKDAAAGKATFVLLLGLDGARARAATLVDDACDALSCYGARADILRGLARFVISRQS